VTQGGSLHTIGRYSSGAAEGRDGKTCGRIYEKILEEGQDFRVNTQFGREKGDKLAVQITGRRR